MGSSTYETVVGRYYRSGLNAQVRRIPAQGIAATDAAYGRATSPHGRATP